LFDPTWTAQNAATLRPPVHRTNATAPSESIFQTVELAYMKRSWGPAEVIWTIPEAMTNA